MLAHDEGGSGGTAESHRSGEGKLAVINSVGSHCWNYDRAFEHSEWNFSAFDIPYHQLFSLPGALRRRSQARHRDFREEIPLFRPDDRRDGSVVWSDILAPRQFGKAAFTVRQMQEVYEVCRRETASVTLRHLQRHVLVTAGERIVGKMFKRFIITGNFRGEG